MTKICERNENYEKNFENINTKIKIASRHVQHYFFFFKNGWLILQGIMQNKKFPKNIFKKRLKLVGDRGVR